MSRRSRHGEWKFGEICQSPDAVCDVVVNKATDDEHGWDHVVDITPPQEAGLPADLQTHLLQCFAQIKTTNGKKPSTKLKLSNAIKAAKSPLPSFVFLLHYRDGIAEPEVYGRHIWVEEISKWLERGRQTELSGRSDLHNLSVTMSFGPRDKLHKRPGDWSFDQLKLHGGAEYARNKTELFQSVGYGEFSQEGTMTLGPLETENDVVLHELGLIEDLPVSEFRVFDKRFGILSSSPIHDFSGGGRIQFTKEGHPLTLQIVSCDGKSFDIPARAWHASLVGFDHPDFKTRIKAGHIDLVMSPGKTKDTFNVTYDIYEESTLPEQLGFLCLVNWSQAGPVQFVAMTDVGKLLGGIISEGLKAEPWMAQYESSTRHLIKLLGAEKSREIKLSLAELTDVNRTLHFAASVFTSGSICFEAEFNNQIEQFEKLGAFLCGQIGEWSYGAIYEAKYGARSTSAKRQTFYLKDPRIVRRFAFKQPLEKTRDFVKREFNDWRSSQDGPVAVLQEGDRIAFSAALEAEGAIEISVD